MLVSLPPFPSSFPSSFMIRSCNISFRFSLPSPFLTGYTLLFAAIPTHHSLIRTLLSYPALTSTVLLSSYIPHSLFVSLTHSFSLTATYPFPTYPTFLQCSSPFHPALLQIFISRPFPSALLPFLFIPLHYRQPFLFRPCSSPSLSSSPSSSFLVQFPPFPPALLLPFLFISLSFLHLAASPTSRPS